MMTRNSLSIFSQPHSLYYFFLEIREGWGYI